MIGSRLGSCELLEEIGKGGMATVYRAYQENMDRQVAVKVIHRSIVRDEVALDRFRREARFIARLEHMHILPIYDFDGVHDPPYIVMRYVDTGTLKDVLRKMRLPLDEVGFLVRQVAAALDYAHEQGIVHRDVKPSNVMVDRKGNAIVTDFGIARLVGDALGPTGMQTGTGASVGTPGYMAPEQARAEPHIDGRTDVYALGVTVFEMVTGRLPFVADSALALMMKQASEPPPRATACNAELPGAIDAVLLRALAKDPAERYQTASEFAAALVKVLGEPVQSAPPTLITTALLTAQLKRPVVEKPSTDSRTTPSEQNKQVTVLHLDAAGYSELVEESQGAEAARRSLRAFKERAARAVQSRDGHIVSQSDTTLTAAWGATVTREDDAERAVRAALEAQAALRELSRGIFVESAEEPLPLRVGVHTGLALLTPGDKGGTFAAAGATVTLAQRLAENAEGTILISHETFREVRGVFDMESDSPMRVRGRKEKVETYRVLSAKKRAFRVRPRGVEGVETRLHGREAELKQLQNAYFNAAEESETQVVTIVGEAGLGKSRLLDEFDKWADLRPEHHWVFRGRATSSMTERPYALLRDVLSFRFEILDDDPLPVALGKIEAGVTAVTGSPDPEMAHLMGYLVGLDLEESEHTKPLRADPKRLAGRGREAVIRFFEKVCRTQPVIMGLEDLHYADDPSLDLLSELTASRPDLPFLMICLARPLLLARRPAWGSGHRFHKRITLAPLDRRDARDLARDLLQKLPDPPKALRDLLVERAEGNPLFMEELLKMLIEDRVIGRDAADVWSADESRLAGVRVPPTLMGVLQMRLDSLLYPERLTLQRAAVIGRVFVSAALAAMDAADQSKVADVSGCLKTLEARGFVERREISSFAGSAEYVFAQAMLRDLIYDTLLEGQRSVYHGAFASWLQGTERAAEYLPLIAEHYEKAGNDEEARKAYLAGARQAAARYAHDDAERLYRAYLALVESPTPESVQATSELGENVLELRGRNAEAEVEYRRALEDAKAIGDKASQGRALRQLGWVCYMTGRREEARGLYEEALPIAREAGDRRNEGITLRKLGIISHEMARWAEARDLYAQALAIARGIGDRGSEVHLLNNTAVVWGTEGRFDEARRLYAEALSVARAAGDRVQEGLVLCNLGSTEGDLGRVDEAQQLLGQALSILLDVGDRRMEGDALCSIAALERDQGLLDRAEVRLERALDLARECGERAAEAHCLCGVAFACYLRGETPQALGLTDRALAIFGELGDTSGRGYVLASLGRFLMTEGRSDEAGPLIEESLRIARNLHETVNVGWRLPRLASSARESGALEQARRLYDEALDVLGDDPLPGAEGMTFSEYAALQLLLSTDLADKLATRSEVILTRIKDNVELTFLLGTRGHIALASGKEAADILARVRDMVAAMGVGPQSPLSRTVAKLERACEAFQSGKPLVCGCCPEDLRSGQLRWLRENRLEAIPPEVMARLGEDGSLRPS